MSLIIPILKPNFLTDAIFVKEGLISCWELDETSGTLAYDSKGSYNMTITGVTINQIGKINKAFSFDGINDYTRVSNPNFTGSAFSINFWINPADITGSASGYSIRIISQYDGGGTPTNGQWLIDLGLNGSAGLLRFIFTTSTGVTALSTSAGILALNIWQMISCVWTGTYLQIYVNATLVASVSKTGTLTNPNTPLTFGQDSVIMPQNYYNGLFEQTAIWNIAVSQDKIDYIYNLGNGLPYINWT